MRDTFFIPIVRRRSRIGNAGILERSIRAYMQRRSARRSRFAWSRSVWWKQAADDATLDLKIQFLQLIRQRTKFSPPNLRIVCIRSRTRRSNGKRRSNAIAQHTLRLNDLIGEPVHGHAADWKAGWPDGSSTQASVPETLTAELND